MRSALTFYCIYRVKVYYTNRQNSTGKENYAHKAER
jgi:hypothetical protein